MLLAGAQFPFESFAATEHSLTILHTNDVHSRLDPFPIDGGKYAGLGGVVNRERIINRIRQNSKHVLLLDAGDMFQGTPYYNLYKGNAEIEMMNLLGYDAGTIGNHDFDNGIEALAENLKRAEFEMINCNYDVSETPLVEFIRPYKIIRKNGLKIGITGVGIELNGLVLKSLYGNTIYNNPIHHANRVANYLRLTKKVRLYHLPFSFGLCLPKQEGKRPCPGKGNRRN